MLRNLTCLLTLATLALCVSCASIDESGDSEPRGPRVICEVELEDDIGLPRHKFSDAFVTFQRENSISTDGRASSALNLTLRGHLHFEAMPLPPLKGVIEVNLGGPCDVKLRREVEWRNPRLDADGVLRLKAKIRTSDLKRGMLIRGRAIMPDGEGIPNQSIRIRPGVVEGNIGEYRAYTDADGYFCVQTDMSVDFGDSSGDGKVFGYPWHYAFTEGFHGYFFRMGYSTQSRPLAWYAVQAEPEFDCVAELGEFIYPGSIVEIHGPEGEAIRSAQVKLFSGTHEYVCFDLPATFPVPPGWYGYSIIANNLTYDGVSYQLIGVVEALPGQRVTEHADLLVLDYAEVHISTPDGEPVSGVVHLEWDGGEDRFSRQDLTQPLKVLTAGRPDLSLDLRPLGYDRIVRRLAPGMDRVDINLTPGPRISTDKRVATVLDARVRVPKTLHGVGFTLHATHESGEVATRFSYLHFDEQGMHLPLPYPGKWTVRLLGAAGWGFPGGMPCDPVSMEIAGGENGEVKFDVPDPPSDYGADECRFVTWVDRSGTRNQVHLEGLQAQTPLGIEPVHEYYNPGSAVPIAIIDGEQSIPVTCGSDRWGMETLLKPRLTSRLHVRLKSSLIDPWQSNPLRIELKSLDGANSCSADTEYGEAYLWLPPGSAELTVHGAGPLYRTEVEIVRGEEQQLEVELSCARVRFEYGWSSDIPLSDRESEAIWVIQDLEGESGTSVRVKHGQGAGTGYFLTPGRYRAAVGGVYLGECEFTVKNGDNIKVMLEVTAQHEHSHINLGLPHPPQTGSHVGVFKLARDHSDTWTKESPSWRIASDSIEIGPILEDIDWRIGGVYATGQRAWWLVPFELPAGASRGRVRATWRLAARMGPEWEAIEGKLSVRLHDDEPWTDLITGHIPFGEIELRVYSGDQEHVFQCTLPRTDGEAGLPETLQQQLRDTGLLD